MSGRATLRHARFDRIADMVADAGATTIVGALFDLGVSSPQFDVAERGFSYRHDAPLDMRMDRSQSVSAFNIVNEWSFEDLVRMLQDYADEKFAARVARAMIAARPIERTVQLADVVTMAIPAAARRRGGHPAKRTFQAIRIAVNSELEILESSLEATIETSRTGSTTGGTHVSLGGRPHREADIPSCGHRGMRLPTRSAMWLRSTSGGESHPCSTRSYEI